MSWGSWGLTKRGEGSELWLSNSADTGSYPSPSHVNPLTIHANSHPPSYETLSHRSSAVSRIINLGAAPTRWGFTKCAAKLEPRHIHHVRYTILGGLACNLPVPQRVFAGKVALRGTRCPRCARCLVRDVRYAPTTHHGGHWERHRYTPRHPLLSPTPVEGVARV